MVFLNINCQQRCAKFEKGGVVVKAADEAELAKKEADIGRLTFAARKALKEYEWGGRWAPASSTWRRTSMRTSMRAEALPQQADRSALARALHESHCVAPSARRAPRWHSPRVACAASNVCSTRRLGPTASASGPEETPTVCCGRAGKFRWGKLPRVE